MPDLKSKEDKEQGDFNVTYCKHCGKPIYTRKGNKYVRKYCNKACMMADKEARYLKRSMTVASRYGVYNVMQVSSIKHKREESMLKAYGTKCMATAASKKEENCCGKTVTSLSSPIHNNIKDCRNSSSSSSFLSSSVFVCKYCGKQKSISKYSTSTITKCPYCGKPVISKGQKELYDYIVKLIGNNKKSIKIKLNDRKAIFPSELDIYIPKLKLAFEFNGTYWHEAGKHKNASTYHLDKSLKCQAKGITLVHIYEFQWINKQNIIKGYVKSLIDAKLKKQKTINSGRYKLKNLLNNIRIFKVSKETGGVKQKKFLRKFFDRHHIHGSKWYYDFDKDIIYAAHLKGRLLGAISLRTDLKSKNVKLSRVCIKNGLDQRLSAYLGRLMLESFVSDYKKDNNANEAKINIFVRSDIAYDGINNSLYELMGFMYYKRNNPDFYYVLKSHGRTFFKHSKGVYMLDNCDNGGSKSNLINTEEFYEKRPDRYWKVYNAGQDVYKLTA